MSDFLQTLPGFRDFAPREYAVNAYLYSVWQKVSACYGFARYEAPVLEATDLYRKKTGGELATQLFCFEDQGGRDVTLRPELTASLARMVIAVQRDYPKPLKWYEIGDCFRYEKPQKGRGRSFVQWNADIVGESSARADAELIALSIDTMLSLGFKKGDFVVRASDRQLWVDFCHQKGIEDIQGFLVVVDRLEKLPKETLEKSLATFDVSLEELDSFIHHAQSTPTEDLEQVAQELRARGMEDFFCIDPTIVRGLAYYTGVVFEVFDQKHNLRAIAGGGRYDKLIGAVSSGKLDLPAVGFAMGDMVLAKLIEATPHARLEMESWLAANTGCDVFAVIADSSLRLQAMEVIGKLRVAGISCDYSFGDQSVGKQFKRAEQSQARFTLLFGGEFPHIPVKNLLSRREDVLHYDDSFISTLQEKISCDIASLLA